MKTLIIYEAIPQDTLLAVVDLSPEEYLYFSKAHNYIQNVDAHCEEKSAVWYTLDCALAENTDYLDGDESVPDMPLRYATKFRQHILKPEDVDLVGVEKLIHTGIFL